MKPFRNGILSVIVVGILMFTNTFTLQSQCVAGNCHQGKGTYLFKDGSSYGGSFKNYFPEGYGKLMYKNGNTYEGQWVRGKKHGQGTFYFKSKNVYSGNFVSDRMEGQGKMAFANGEFYEGDWLKNKAHGKGSWTYPTGESYRGNFFAGMRQGEGQWTYADGSTYTGLWHQNQKHGEGTLIAMNGSQKNQSYSHGRLVKEVLQNKTRPTNHIALVDCNNNFCDGVRGYYVYGDGSRFEGSFSNGQSDGSGICYYVNGDVYHGDWKDHSPHGRGTMKTLGGSVFSGIWEGGRFVREEKLNNNDVAVINQQASKPVIQNSKGKIYALIVGVAQYNHTKSLKYTDDDAYRLYAFLKSPEGGALADNQIKLLIDDAATRPAIYKELQSWARKAGENDIIFVYMSGHGLPGAFVPHDFDGRNNLLTYSDIFALLDASSAKHRLFIADACHSGSMASRGADWESSLSDFYQAFETSKGGSAFISSSKSEEVSLEHGGLRQGIFSHFLIRGLKGEANTNKDDLVTVDELFQFVSREVKSYTAGAQNPSISGQYDPLMPVAMVMER